MDFVAFINISLGQDWLNNVYTVTIFLSISLSVHSSSVERWFQKCPSKLLRCRERGHFCLGCRPRCSWLQPVIQRSGSWQLCPRQRPSTSAQLRGQALYSTCQQQTEALLGPRVSRDLGERHSVGSPRGHLPQRRHGHRRGYGRPLRNRSQTIGKKARRMPSAFSFLTLYGKPWMPGRQVFFEGAAWWKGHCVLEMEYITKIRWEAQWKPRTEPEEVSSLPSKANDGPERRARGRVAEVTEPVAGSVGRPRGQRGSDRSPGPGDGSLTEYCDSLFALVKK